MFSVVIPLYNKEDSIKNTVLSVLSQTYQDFEIVIVNDGSTDASVEVIEAENIANLRIIHQKNQGVSAARNTGIKSSNFEWIAFLDGDDLWETDHLETVAKMIKSFPDELVFTTSFRYSDDRFMFKSERTSSVFIIGDYFSEATVERLIWTSIVVINKKCFDSSGMFNVSLSRGEDLDLWSRIARDYRIVKTKHITATYRIDAENRACKQEAPYETSFVSVITLKGVRGSERAYYKRIILKKIKESVRFMRFREVLKILIQHNIQLLR